MKVLHVISGLTGGGAELALAALAPALTRHGVVSVVACLGPEGPAAGRLQAAGVEIRYLRLRGATDAIPGWWRLRRVLGETRPDLLHGWMHQGALAASVSAAWARPRPPVVWGLRRTFGAPHTETPAERAAIALCRLLQRSPAAVVHNSRAGLEAHVVRGYRAGRAVVIPNGFDTERFHPAGAAERARARRDLGMDDATILVGLMGRAHPMKDAEGFVRAAARIVEAHPEVRFLVMGRGYGDAHHPARRLAAELGVANAVAFRDETSEPERWVAALNIAVSASAHSEGFSNAVGEAMACAVPCVATAVGDAAALVGDAGVVVPPGDTAALARAIGDLLAASPEARAATGLRGRARIVRDYSLERVAERYATLYRSVLPEAAA